MYPHLSQIFILALLLSACTNGLEKKPTVLAEVGTQMLTMEEAKREIPPTVFESDSSKALVQYRDEWIRRQVILQEAERLNFRNRQDVQQKLKRLEEEYILHSIRDYIINEFEDGLEVTEQEARNYYQQNKDKFTLDERYVQYRHLIAESMNAAESAKRALMRGQSWEEVATAYSKYPDLKIREAQNYWPSSIAGGDVAMLNRYLRVIGPSEISPTHRVGNEYHFVQLLDERPEGDHPDLDWLIDQIQEWLILEKRKRAFNTYVKNLYLQGQANNEIQIYTVTNETNTAETDTASLNQIYNEE